MTASDQRPEKANIVHATSGVVIATSPDAADALEKVKRDQYDLVISDINMPGMKGYELLKEIGDIAPETKTALITAYNVDEYVRIAKHHGICNIISKTTPFNFDEVEALVRGLITGDIFGIEKHLHPGFQLLGSHILQNSNQSKEVRSDILKNLPPFKKEDHEVKLVLDEIMTNAIYHSSVLETGGKKYPEYKYVELDEPEYVHVNYGSDHEKICISIVDNQGTLDKERVLYLIDRHVHAEGILDESGRGIFMSRLFADRIIINIEPKNKTEFIIIFYLEPTAFKGYKPLYINQL